MNNSIRCLITGASGFVGGYLCRGLAEAGWEIVAAHHTKPLKKSAADKCAEIQQRDLRNSAEVDSLIKSAMPNVVLHCAAEANTTNCENDPEAALQANVVVTENLLAACERKSLERFFFLSSEMVFDGAPCPLDGFSERDRPLPRSTYSRTKFQAECTVLGSTLNVSVLRLALVYGPGNENILGKMRGGFGTGELALFADEYRTPLFVGDLLPVILRLQSRPEEGRLLHVGGSERCSRLDFGRQMSSEYGMDQSKIRAVSRADVFSPFPRPPDLSLDSGALATILGRPLSSIKAGLELCRREDSLW